jgi:hypothetical protein
VKQAFEDGYTARLNGAAQPEIAGASSYRDVLFACGWRAANAAATIKSVKDALDELGIVQSNCMSDSPIVVGLSVAQRVRLLQAEVLGLRAMVIEQGGAK